MPQRLSDAPGVARGVDKYKHVPFTCFLALSSAGKRQEKVYYANKISDFVEDALDTICNASEEITFDYTKPIANTPRFGNQTGRLSFSGHACRRESFTKLPVGERTVVNSGEFKTGAGAANASNRTPDPEMDALAKDLKTIIQTATGLEVIRIELANYIYGQRGSTFPI